MVIRSGLCWALAGACVLALAAGCGTGQPATSDPATVLRKAGDTTLAAGSAHVKEALSLQGAPPYTADGTLSWASGSTAELTVTGLGPAQRVRLTDDALYVSMPAALGALAPGKTWLTKSYADVPREFGPLGQLLTAALAHTYPTRPIAMLLQAGDLRLIADQQREGVATAHYAGTVDVDKLVADPRLGLTDQVIAELRQELHSRGANTEKLDVWLDDQNRPVHVEAGAGGLTGTLDYDGYGEPVHISAPPPDQVVDAARLQKSLGG